MTTRLPPSLYLNVMPDTDRADFRSMFRGWLQALCQSPKKCAFGWNKQPEIGFRNSCIVLVPVWGTGNGFSCSRKNCENTPPYVPRTLCGTTPLYLRSSPKAQSGGQRSIYALNV